MGINSVNGQDPQIVLNSNAPPVPRSRTAESARESVPRARQREELSEKQVRQAAKPAEIAPRPASTRPRLRVDEKSKRIVAQILDENDKVIKQIPPEVLLRIAARFEELRGLLFDENV